MVVSSADKAIANADKQTKVDPGYCLKYVRTWLGIGSKEPDAATAWKNAIGKHPGDKKPPKGAPVFWTGGSSGHGHIALARGKNMRTTDKPSGQCGNDDGTWPRKQWGHKYVGWAEGFNGVRIPYLKGGGSDWRASGDVYVDKLKKGQKNSESVSRLRYRLTNHVDMPDSKKPGYGTSDQSTGADWGSKVTEAVKYFQTKIRPNVSGPKDGSSMSNDQANQIFGNNYKVHKK